MRESRNVQQYVDLLARHLQVAVTDSEYAVIQDMAQTIVLHVRSYTLIELAEQFQKDGRHRAAQYVVENYAKPARDEMGELLQRLRQQMEARDV